MLLKLLSILHSGRTPPFPQIYKCGLIFLSASHRIENPIPTYTSNNKQQEEEEPFTDRDINIRNERCREWDPSRRTGSRWWSARRPPPLPPRRTRRPSTPPAAPAQISKPSRNVRFLPSPFFDWFGFRIPNPRIIRIVSFHVKICYIIAKSLLIVVVIMIVYLGCRSFDFCCWFLSVNQYYYVLNSMFGYWLFWINEVFDYKLFWIQNELIQTHTNLRCDYGFWSLQSFHLK